MAVGAGPACVFCAVVDGTTSAQVVAADAATLTILDLRQPPWPDGAHVLVLPRRHVEILDDVNDEIGAALMRAVTQAVRLVRRAFEPPGINIWQSNGEAAGQEVPHVHLHVFTRRPDDGLLRVYPTAPATPDPTALAELATRLRGAKSAISFRATSSEGEREEAGR